MSQTADITAHLYAPLPDNPTEGDIQAGVAALIHEAQQRGATRSFEGHTLASGAKCRVIESGEYRVRYIKAFDPETRSLVHRLDTFIA